MPRTIVVPLDGSALAERALAYATSLVTGRDGRLVLVRSTAPPAVPSRGALTLSVSPEQARADLDAVAERLRAQGFGVVTRLSPDTAAPAILAAAAAERADLIVMATHGRGGLRRWLQGSVADTVLQQARVPVLLVPAAAARRWPPESALRVVVPLDGSALAETALDQLDGLIGDHPAVIFLVGVIETAPGMLRNGPDVADVDAAPLVGEAHGYLGRAAERLARPHRRVQTAVLLGDPAVAIVGLAREHAAHLIIMATHGRGGLSRFLLGSVATVVLERTSTPLLLVRPAVALADARGALAAALTH
jgi:nucleotide-binding universal stress UspA family protein